MYEEQLVYIDSSYMMFYGGAAVLALVACIYLLFRRSNAIVPGITPPLRLRRWTAAFFAVMFLSHLWWWLIIHYALIGDLWLNFMVAASLDCLMVVPTLIAVMVVMLQDRRRPLWPIAVIQVSVVAFFAVCIPQRSNTIVPLIQYYFLFLGVGFIIYMVLALRQYRLWLCDNYADLEHKEIRYSIMALVVGLLFNVFYLSGSTGMVTQQYAVQAFDYMFVILLLWRVETLQTLDDTSDTAAGMLDSEEDTAMPALETPTTLPPDIDLLLEGRVEATQLYLRHDIKIGDLCKAIGTNRSYLSLYFKRQNTTYNAYINGLRVKHFIRLYREAVAAKRTFTVQQLAEESGFRNYATFGKAFKQQMGQTATAWMRDAAE